MNGVSYPLAYTHISRAQTAIGCCASASVNTEKARGSTQSSSSTHATYSAVEDVYKRQHHQHAREVVLPGAKTGQDQAQASHVSPCMVTENAVVENAVPWSISHPELIAVKYRFEAIKGELTA